MSFENRVIIVTGAATGIGAATAVNFATSKAKLVLVDINKDALEKTGEQCRALTGKNNVIILISDLSKEDQVRNVITKTIEKFKTIHVLVNNAGVTAKGNIFTENFLDNFDRIYAINLKAPMLLTHLAVPYLKETKGNIVNITSVGGIKPLPDHIVYNSSKAALGHFTKNIAMELAPYGIRANSIAPAGVKTELIRTLGITDVEAFNKRRARQLPLKRMVEPEELGKLIAFLASDDARSITGIEHVVDAGHLLAGETPKYSD